MTEARRIDRPTGRGDEAVARVAAAATRSVLADGGGAFDVGGALDRVLPGGAAWREALQRWPATVLGVAGAVGFLLGRSRGEVVVSGARAGLAHVLAERVADLERGLSAARPEQEQEPGESDSPS